MLDLLLVFCRNITTWIEVKEKPTKLVGYNCSPILAKDLGAKGHSCLHVQSNRGKSPNTGDVAEWLKATVC
jgi:hypothetical protein